jgi:hypothetical protein
MARRFGFWWLTAAIFFAGVILRLVSNMLNVLPWNELLRELANAMVIAAVLAAIVDRYAKLRLATEVGEKIAAKVYGYHLPTEVRDELREVTEFHFILRNIIWDIRMMEPEDESPAGSLLWQWVLRYDILNVSDSTRTFKQAATTTSVLPGVPNDMQTTRILAVAHYVNHKEIYRHSAGQPAFDTCLKTDAKMVAWTDREGVEIPPMRDTSNVYRFESVTKKLVAESEVRSVFLRYPAIGFEIVAEVPDRYTAWSSFDVMVARTAPLGREHALRWKSDAVYLNKQRISIKHMRA